MSTFKAFRSVLLRGIVSGAVRSCRARSVATMLVMLAALNAAFLFSGCQTTKKVELPKVVAEDASTEELCSAINANSAKIQSIYATNASIGVQNQPGWANCRLLFDRPNKLRLVGTASIVGRVVDCGCDGDQFWFWSSFQNPDELYYCKLDQYQGSSLSNAIPIDPTWFPEAFGVVEIKEEDVEDKRNAEGEILLTVKNQRPDGVYRKRIYVEPRTAAIQRQDVQNPQGDTIVSVVVREQQYVSDPGVVMPRKLEIRCETTNDTLIVDLGTPTLNDASKMEASVFQRPTDLKATAVDLGASSANKAQANAVPPTNYQKVRTETETARSTPQTPAPATSQNTALVATTRPTLNNSASDQTTASTAAKGPGVVSFPSSFASTPPSAQTAATSEPLVATPVSDSAVVAVVPSGGPQVLPANDSAFAQRILNPQELQNAQSAITGVAQQQSATPTNPYNNNQATPYASQPLATNQAQASATAATFQAPAQTLQQPQQQQSAGTGFQPVQSQTVQPIANAGAVDAAFQAPTLQSTQPQTTQPTLQSTQPQTSATPSLGFNDYSAVGSTTPAATASDVPPVTSDSPSAPSQPGDPLEEDFSDLLPF